MSSMSGSILRVSICGYNSCTYFKRAANVAVAMETLYPQKLEVRIFNCKDRTAYKTWLADEKPSLNLTGAHQSHTSSPIVWFNENEFLGGCDDFLAYVKTNLVSTSSLSAGVRSKATKEAQVNAWVSDGMTTNDPQYDYDLVVIGGGSGGIACADEAAKHGAKVALLDYVSPSEHGAKWGLGGTCVNVGCIPKKLCHQASLLGEGFEDMGHFGWNVKDKPTHDWATLCQSFRNHIRSLNFKYRVSLNEASIDYIPSLGRLVDKHTVECYDPKDASSTKSITAGRTVIAVGGRPSKLSIPGGEYAIDSDDIFQMDWTKTACGNPGKTLVIGASYVALECAGFLNGIGYDVTIMVRSILLRGFDREFSDIIGDHMKATGTKFIEKQVPEKIEKLDNGKFKVYWANGTCYDEFDTVFSAIGRSPCTDNLGCDAAGVKLGRKNKVECNEVDQSSVPNVYAIGDVVENMLELTPVAIMAGRKLARRLFKSGPNEFMDYVNIATTVFTPLEYGACGMSEEDAIEKYGEDDIEVYHSKLKPLEWELNHEKPDGFAKAKLICVISENERVVGLHILGPNAGEVTQGFAVAMRKGATKKDFDDTVGIHPTVAEDLTLLSVTKRSGLSEDKGNC